MNKKNTETLNNLFSGIDHIKSLSSNLKSENCVELTMAIYDMEDDLHFLLDQIAIETDDFSSIKIQAIFDYPPDHKFNKRFIEIYNKYREQE